MEWKERIGERGSTIVEAVPVESDEEDEESGVRQGRMRVSSVVASVVSEE